MNLLGWLKFVHEDERGVLPIIAGIGAIGSLIGGLKQGQAADTQSAAAMKSAETQEKVADYQLARQAQTDPLFLSILSSMLGRTQGGPRLFGRKRGVPIFAGLEGRTAPLPPPQRIGSAPSGAPGAGGAPVIGDEERRLLEHMRQNRPVAEREF